MFFRSYAKKKSEDLFVRFQKFLSGDEVGQELYGLITHAFLDFLQADAVSLLRREEAEQRFVLQSHVGPVPFTASWDANHPVLLWMQREGEPLSKRAIVADPLQWVDLREPILSYFSTWNCDWVFPLFVRRECIGLINVKCEHFEIEEASLKALLDWIAIRIENQTLLESCHKKDLALAELDKLKSQFLAQLSHEIRTPMHAILGLSELLEIQLENLSEEQKAWLGTIQSEASRLLNVLEDLLDLAKHQAGLAVLEVKKIDFKRLIFEVLESLRAEIPSAVTTELDWPEDAPRVYGDERELKRLLWHLLSNAIKFTKEGTIKISSQKLGERLCVAIEDSGIGMSAEEQQKIFDRFRQVEEGANRRFEGAGLGLAIAKGIVELHGGRIWVESQKGSGSVFYFTLPLRPGDFNRD